MTQKRTARPRFTRRVNGQMMTDIVLRASVTAEELDRYNTMARKMGYTDYAHYLTGALSNAEIAFQERYDEYTTNEEGQA